MLMSHGHDPSWRSACIKMKGQRRKSFFGELRDKHMNERRRTGGSPNTPPLWRYENSATTPTTTTTVSGAQLELYEMSRFGGTLPPRGSQCVTANHSSNACNDKSGDIWSFEGRTSSMEVNLVSAPATPPIDKSVPAAPTTHTDVQLDPEFEELIQPPSVRLLRKFTMIADKKGPSKTSLSPKMTLSSISNKFRAKFNDLPMPRKKIWNRSARRAGGGAGPSHRNIVNTDTLKTPEKDSSTSSLRQFELVQSPRIVDSDEICRLESSIVEESSPIKPIKKRRKRSHSARLMTAPLRVSSQKSQDLTAPRINYPSSGNNNSGEKLSRSSSQMYEILSTQSSSTASPINRTPMSEWIHQDYSSVFACSERNEEIIVHLDSPKQDRQDASSSKRRSAVRPSPGSSLLESFTAITARYNSSVRLFAHDLRNGKYDQETPLHLLIRKVVQRQDKLLVQTVAYDLNERRDRWVLFKPTDMSEITEGASVKVYPPWQEILISGTGETMIVGTDFYKILQRSNLNLTEEQTQEIMELPLPTCFDTRVPDPLFLDMVPYHIKSVNHTIDYHITRFHSMLDINIVILHMWAHISPALCLMKDSNDEMSFLQIPKTSGETQQQLALTEFFPGKCFKLLQIASAGKICISKKLAPFSVMHLFGGKQTFYYSLNWQPGTSEFIPEKDFVIPTTEMKRDFKNIDDVYSAPHNQDHRVTLKCRIKEKEHDHILVTDDESDRSLRIEFVFDSRYDELREYSASCPSNRTLQLNFLRVIQGKRIWDCYTTYAEVDDDDEEEELDSFLNNSSSSNTNQ